jgi:phosphate transport system permease protein
MSNQALPRPRFEAPQPEPGPPEERAKAALKEETNRAPLLQGRVSELPDTGALPFIYGTLATSLLALAMAVPLALGVAIFLSELCPAKLRAPISFLTELLAAIPSVVYGLWAVFVLVPIMRDQLRAVAGEVSRLDGFLWRDNFGVGLLTASIILAIMILPIISSITRDIMLAVPVSQREAVLALGATRWEMIRTGVLRNARIGIVGAVILGLGRALGETMAVTMVIGNHPDIVEEPVCARNTRWPA